MWSDGGPGLVDRCAEERNSIDFSTCYAVVVHDGHVWTHEQTLALVPPEQARFYEPLAFLGKADGKKLMVATVPDLDAHGPPDDIGAWLSLRDLARHHEGQGSQVREIAATAVAMTTWHHRNSACPRCGAPTRSREGGWSRRCEKDGTDHYPRTDPAVIVQITDAQDRLLLAHVSYHSPRRFSHIAGYVEPGETLEEAVHREAHEEVRIPLEKVTYAGSQSWPFPASMMIAFRAQARATDITVDGVEVETAQFFTREEIAQAVGDGSVVLAPPGSISRWLVDDWYDGAVHGVPGVTAD